MPEYSISKIDKIEPESYEPAFWEKVTKQAAESGELWKDCSWDTVIVDEAQDLGRYEWTIATQCARKPPRIWCFADEYRNQPGVWSAADCCYSPRV